MASPRITLYFDIGSPFSQIGFHILRVMSNQSRHRRVYRPTILIDLSAELSRLLEMPDRLRAGSTS